jgi:hypothetical protein
MLINQQACVPKNVERAVERDALTALALAMPALRQARITAYREGLRAADIKDMPALATAESARTEAFKSLGRVIRMAHVVLFADGATQAQKIALLRETTEAVSELALAFSTGPLPAVRLPAGVVEGLSLLRAALYTLAPAPAADAGAVDGPPPADAPRPPAVAATDAEVDR